MRLYGNFIAIIIACAVTIMLQTSLTLATISQQSNSGLPGLHHSNLYMQSTSLMKVEDNNYQFYLSGVVDCSEDSKLTGIKEFRIQSNSFGIDLHLAEITNMLIYASPSSNIVYKQSPTSPIVLDHNQVIFPFEWDQGKIPEFSADHLLIEFTINVKEIPGIQTVSWFGEINFVLTTIQNDVEVSAYRLVTLPIFDNEININANTTSTLFHTHAMLSHTNNPVIPDDLIIDINYQNTSSQEQQQQQQQSETNLPTILFTSFWTKFPFSFTPQPQSENIMDKDINNDDDGPTKSLSYMVYELVGPFEFITNPDQTTLDVPCLLNDIDVTSFQITPTSILFFFSDYIKANLLLNDSLALVCPKYLITTKHQGTQSKFTPMVGQFSLNAYFFETNDEDAQIPDEYFVQINAQYAHSTMIKILSDRTISPYALSLKQVEEDKFTYVKASVLYQDYFNITIPDDASRNQFQYLTDHEITFRLIGSTYTRDGANIYFNDIDLISQSPWLKQINAPITTGQFPQYTTASIPQHLPKGPIVSFYAEMFANVEKNNTLTSPQLNRDQADPYTIVDYSLLSPSIDGSIARPFIMKQTPFLRYVKFDPLADEVKITTHPFWKIPSISLQFELINLQNNIDFIEIYTPRAEMLRFNGQFQCDLIQINNKKNSTQAITGKDETNLGKFNAYSGQYYYGSNTTNIVNQTAIYLKFEEKFEYGNALQKTQTYRVKCNGGGSMDYYYAKFHKNYKIEQDFLSFRGGSMVNVEKKENIIYYQTSVVSDLKPADKYPVTAGAIFMLSITIIGGIAYLWLSCQPSKPPNNENTQEEPLIHDQYDTEYNPSDFDSAPVNSYEGDAI